MSNFFQGIHVWRYTEDLRLGQFHLDSGYPHTILLEFNIDARIVDAAYADNKKKMVYIFKGIL